MQFAVGSSARAVGYIYNVQIEGDIGGDAKKVHKGKSQIPLLNGVLILFCDTCHTFDVIQVALNHVHDPARRLVECMFGLKTGVVSS